MLFTTPLLFPKVRRGVLGMHSETRECAHHRSREALVALRAQLVPRLFADVHHILLETGKIANDQVLNKG